MPSKFLSFLSIPAALLWAGISCLGLGCQPHTGDSVPIFAPTKDGSPWTRAGVTILMLAAARWWLCSLPLAQENCGWSSRGLTKVVEMWGKPSSSSLEDVFHIPLPRGYCDHPDLGKNSKGFWSCWQLCTNEHSIYGRKRLTVLLLWVPVG